MMHKIDGFDLKYASRTGWKAEMHPSGRMVEIIPVTWTKGFRKDRETGDAFQEIWYKNPDEIIERKKILISSVVCSLPLFWHCRSLKTCGDDPANV